MLIRPKDTVVEKDPLAMAEQSLAAEQAAEEGYKAE
jgi:hypothetical protein